MKRFYVALAIVICIAGCKSEPNPASSIAVHTIVQQVEDGGVSPKDLQKADVAGLQVWLMQHSDVAKNIAGQCKAAMKPDSAWEHSEEGRICLAEKGNGLLN